MKRIRYEGKVISHLATFYYWIQEDEIRKLQTRHSVCYHQNVFRKGIILFLTKYCFVSLSSNEMKNTPLQYSRFQWACGSQLAHFSSFGNHSSFKENCGERKRVHTHNAIRHHHLCKYVHNSLILYKNTFFLAFNIIYIIQYHISFSIVLSCFFLLLSVYHNSQFDKEFDFPKWNSRVRFAVAICYLSLALMPTVWNTPEKNRNEEELSIEEFIYALFHVCIFSILT